MADMHDSGKRETGKTGAQTDPSHSIAAMELLSPYSLWSLSEWLGKGASKYAPRNWEQGIKFSICISKLQRHLQEYLMGKTDEDHWAAVGFWWHAIAHYEKMIEMGLLPAELDDMPKYEQQVKKTLAQEISDEIAQRMPSFEEIATWPTIECVPSKGWQIRLPSGFFLHNCNNAFAVPFYHGTKEIAERCVIDYLRSRL